ncbi:MAG: hypothetical protein KY475_01120 [Planctomycetes bacterium]|nr:hypothetical protein [Planctomycetota bacterium]
MPNSGASFLMIVLALASALPAAERRSARILPAAARAYVSVADYDVFQERWSATNLSALLDSPELRAFRDQIEDQLGVRQAEMERLYGASLEELLSLSVGEAAVGVVETSDEKTTLMFLVEVGDDRAAVESLLMKAEARLLGQGGRKSEQVIAGTKATIYHVPRPDAEDEEVVHFVKEGVLAVSGDLATAADALQQWDEPREGKLASLPAYRDVEDRLAAADPNANPPVIFFADPLRLDELLDPPELQADGTRRPTFADRHGFDAIQAIGGTLDAAAGSYDLVYRLAVYAPPPHEKGMQILDFPPGEDFAPPAWAPDYLSSLTTLYWRVEKIIEHIGPLFDDVAANDEFGTFDVISNDVKTELDVDLKELFARLGPRLVISSDYLPDVAGASQRDMVAVEIKPGEEAKVEEEIARLLRDDPTVERIVVQVPHREGQRIVLNDRTLWRVGEAGGLGGRSDRRGFTAAGVMVARGYLFIATNYDMLRRLFSPEGQVRSPRLADAADFQQAMKQLDALDPQPACGRMFARTERDFYTTYEMLRQGRIDEAETIYGRGITMLLEQLGDEVKLDFDSLPEFAEISKFLGDSAATIAPQPNGWIITGFLKPK